MIFRVFRFVARIYSFIGIDKSILTQDGDGVNRIRKLDDQSKLFLRPFLNLNEKKNFRRVFTRGIFLRKIRIEIQTIQTSSREILGIEKEKGKKKIIVSNGRTSERKFAKKPRLTLHVLLFFKSWEDLMKFLKSSAATTAIVRGRRSDFSTRSFNELHRLNKERKKDKRKGGRKIVIAISREGNRTEFDNPSISSNLLDRDLNTNCVEREVCPHWRSIFMDSYLWRKTRGENGYIDVKEKGKSRILSEILETKIII